MASGSGIQWMMELDAKLDGAKAMLKELSASEHAADQADKALKKMEGHTFSNLFKSIFKAELAVKALEKGAELAYEGVKKLGEKMWESIQIAAGAERLDKVFANMLGPEGGKETLEYLEKFAGLSEHTDDAVKAVGVDLLRTGLRGADFRNALAAAADVAANATDKTAAFGEAAGALGKAYELGKIDKRLIYALRLPFGEVEKELSKGMGLSQKQIKKQIQEGTLDASKALDILYDVMERKSGKKLGGLTLGMAKGMDALLEKFKDIPEEMAKNLRNTQGFKDIETSLSNFLDVVAPKLLDTNGAMGKILDTVGAKLKDIDWDSVMVKVERLVELAKEWVDPIEKVAKAMLKVAEGILALPSLGNWIGDVAGDAAILLKTGRVGQTAERRREKWMDVEWERRQAAINSHEVAGGFNKGLIDAISAPRNAGAYFIQQVDEGVRDEAEIHSPSRLFARHGRMLALGLAVGMREGSARASDAGGAMVPSLSGIGSSGGGSGVNAGGITVNLTIPVAGGSSSSASEIAQSVQAILPSILIGALEQVAVQAGAT
jgi:hypothetical protein